LKRPPAFRILAAGLVLLAILALDFGSKQVYRNFQPRRPTPETAHREYHPHYHHGLRPNASVTDSFGPLSYPFFSNSLGMRDGSVREVSLTKSGPRILLIGDSFTEGVGLPWEKTFPGILASALGSEGVEVLNSGVNSYCPILFKGRLKYLFDQKGLEVDRVVACIDISDVMQELTYQEKPDNTVKEQPLFPEHYGEIDRQNQRDDWIRKNIEDQFTLLGAFARNLRIWWRDHKGGPGVRQYDEIPTWAYVWPDYQGPYGALIEKGLRLAQRHMTEVAADLRQRDIALTVVVYPWPQQLPYSFRPSRAETVWAEWADENQASFISLFSDFARLGDPGFVRDNYFLRNDSHWNERGHAKVAELLLGKYRSFVLPPPQKKRMKREVKS